MAKQLYFQGTGRRKTSTARVFMRPGTGRIVVNKRPVEEYFVRDTLLRELRRPLQIAEIDGDVDVIINVAGGGHSGQAGAIRLGIARAITAMNFIHRAPLKKAGMLTRDARKVERKKYGRAGARRSFQFSKR